MVLSENPLTDSIWAFKKLDSKSSFDLETRIPFPPPPLDALHTLLADEAICIGPAPSTESYLDMERILTACVVMKADAIHPGFGFLSENARFAELCEKCNIRFIGPSAEIINKMGNKSEARKTMMAAGVPVVPGSKEPPSWSFSPQIYFPSC